MRRAFGLFAASSALALGYACEGGELDAFSAVGGQSGRGGASGTNGAPTGGTSFGGEGGASPDTLVIDDFEDGNRVIELNEGTWFVTHDGSGSQKLEIIAPSVPQPEDSSFALHTSGVGFVDFAAVVCDVSGDAATVDASAYPAITFVARAEPGSARNVHLSFYSNNVNFAVPLTLSTTWDRHTVRFSAALPLEDPNARLDPRFLAAIQFNVPARASFDFWLDDLAFVR